MDHVTLVDLRRAKTAESVAEMVLDTLREERAAASTEAGKLFVGGLDAEAVQMRDYVKDLDNRILQAQDAARDARHNYSALQEQRLQQTLPPLSPR